MRHFPGVTPRLSCWRLEPRNSYDEELVWRLTQQHGGSVSISYAWVDFWIAPEWESLLILACPDLVRHSERDLY